MQRPKTTIAAMRLGAFRDKPKTGIIPMTAVMPVITGIRARDVILISFSNRQVNKGIMIAAIPDNKIISEDTDLDSIRERTFLETKNVSG